MPLLKTGATYQNPCKLGDDLEIRTCVEAWANRTFLVNHEVIHSDGRLALSGFEYAARWWCRHQSRKKGSRPWKSPTTLRPDFQIDRTAVAISSSKPSALDVL